MIPRKAQVKKKKKTNKYGSKIITHNSRVVMEKVRVSRFRSKHAQTKEIVQEDQLDQSMKVEGVEMWRERRRRKKEVKRKKKKQRGRKINEL